MFPPVSPSVSLAMNRTVKDLANPSNKRDKKVPPTENNNRGFLPYLSESLPTIGAAKNCPRGYIAVSIPIMNSLAPNSLA